MSRYDTLQQIRTLPQMVPEYRPKTGGEPDRSGFREQFGSHFKSSLE